VAQAWHGRLAELVGGNPGSGLEDEARMVIEIATDPGDSDWRLPC